jgi:hypothetical protein
MVLDGVSDPPHEQVGDSIGSLVPPLAPLAGIIRPADIRRRNTGLPVDWQSRSDADPGQAEMLGNQSARRLKLVCKDGIGANVTKRGRCFPA